MYARYFATSEMRSARISFAPSMAAFASATPFSSETYWAASVSIGSFVTCSRIVSASGSRPLSFAMLALVFLFGRNGRYKSSTATIVSASSIFFFKSAVSFP